MKPETLSTILSRLRACPEAVEWAKGYKNLAKAYAACKRGDHLLWLAFKIIGPTRHTKAGKALWLARADCAATALKFYEKKHPGDKRVRECIQGVRDYARGKIDAARLDELRRADADAAVGAAAAAYAAAYAAYAAAYAAFAAAEVATAAAAYAERSKALAKCAVIVRKHLPFKMLYAAYVERGRDQHKRPE